VAATVIAGLLLGTGAGTARHAAAAEGGASFLAMYFSEEEQHVLAATRSLSSIEHVAENVTVITADEIRLMNAHSLADALTMVPGVHVAPTGVFGSIATALVLGSDPRHVAVFWDGVPLANLGDNVAELGFVPVHDIERIEIVKGPASSVWGSALGGVVNIVTRAAGRLPLEGEVRASYGTEASGDYRATAAGRTGSVGWFLSGTRLETHGLTPGFDVSQNQVSARLDAELGARARVHAAFSGGHGWRGEGYDEAYDTDYEDEYRTALAVLGATAGLAPGIEAEASVWDARLTANYTQSTLGTGEEIFVDENRNRRRGGGIKLTWQRPEQVFVFGADYRRGCLDTTSIPDRTPTVDERAVYANGTLDFGALAVIPGVRYDDVSTTGSIVSPSLGATYALGVRTLLRAAVARGFAAPTLVDTSGSSELFGFRSSGNLDMEKVWAYQAGIESDVAQRIWIKLSVFRHELHDVLAALEIPDDPVYVFTTVNQDRQRREGISLEWRTAAWHDWTFFGGATFVRAEDLGTGEPVRAVPNEEYQASLEYDDRSSLRALVQGHYYREHGIIDGGARYSNMLVDAHLRRRVLLRGAWGLELFASVHNLFDGDLTWAAIYPTPGRWVEAGASVTF